MIEGGCVGNVEPVGSGVQLKAGKPQRGYYLSATARECNFVCPQPVASPSLSSTFGFPNNVY